MKNRILTFIQWIIIIVLIYLSDDCSGQYNFCLMKVGCLRDECCFPVVLNFHKNCYKLPYCSKSFEGDCCLNSQVIQLDSGYYYGFSQLLDDNYGYRDNGRRYLTSYLGINYAKSPSKELGERFKKPKPLDRSQSKIMAMSYGPSCPQNDKYIKELVNTTISEDCLNMNIFVLNDTLNSRGRKTLYPIMVFFHGIDHKYGSANLFPGQILAQQGIMVITVNYRLGALGFLSTEESSSLGNYGLWDQRAALEFIQKNGEKFMGDVTKVTLVGFGSGAADVALHMMALDAVKSSQQLFHRAMLLSGSDLMVGGFVTEKDEAKRYAEELGVRAGCNKNEKSLVDCLAEKNFLDIAKAADEVEVHGVKWNSRPWSPCIDGEFMGDFPLNLRRQSKFTRMRVIGGLGEGSLGYQMISDKHPELLKQGGVNSSEWRSILRQIVGKDDALDLGGSALDLEFEYTYWPDSSNATWRLRQLAHLLTDRFIGAGLDQTLKFQSDALPLRNWTQMFVLRYNNPLRPRTNAWMNMPQLGAELDYLFGLTYLNNTQRSTVGLKNKPDDYSPTAKLDINMTDYFMYFAVNFVTHGNATPDVIRNLTFDTYRPENRTYFLLNLNEGFMNDFDLLQDYRITHYAFWNNYYSKLLKRLPRYTTPFPTPAYLDHLKVSTFSLSGALAVAVIILLILLIVLIRKRRQLT